MIRIFCLLVAVTLVLCACDRRAGSGPTVVLLTKIRGIEYFNAAEIGAREAAAELGVDLVFDGPMEAKADKQVEMIESWVGRADVIAISPNDPVAVAPALRRAREAGVRVITWDADAEPDAREFFVNQATAKAVGAKLVDVMAQIAGPDAPVVIITGSLTAANQNEWIKWMRVRMAEAYPRMREVLPPQPSEEDQQLAFRVTQDVLKANPEVRGVFGITSVALPGAADAVERAGLSGKVAVTGLSTPSSMRPWVKGGTVKAFVLWNPVDLGYLTVYAANALLAGDLAPGATRLEAGRLGAVEVVGDQVLLGEPMVFDASNIDEFDF